VIVAVIPALNEEANVADVVRGVGPHVDRVIVSDNGSWDATAERARRAGAEVVLEPQRGYGAACLTGIARARELDADVVLFLDCDGSDDPEDAPHLLSPILEGVADLTLGVRTSESTEPGAMTPVQRFGNWLAPRLMHLATGARYRDLPPFKAIRRSSLDLLGLADRGYGFTVEFLFRAHAERLRTQEIVVACRARSGGKSKISGTVRGSVRAGGKIIAVIARHALRSRSRIGSGG
jgi:glycosyltransferase involved in cell wall biosynthesis